MKVLFCSRQFIRGVLLWNDGKTVERFANGKRIALFSTIVSIGHLQFVSLREFFTVMDEIDKTFDRRERGAVNRTKHRRRATDIHVAPKPKQPFFPSSDVTE